MSSTPITVAQLAQDMDLPNFARHTLLGSIQLDACLHVTAERGVGMLVEPVNMAPFVYLEPAGLQQFPYQPGSGTDKLRQRMLASMAFSNAVEQSMRRRQQMPDASDANALANEPSPQKPASTRPRMKP